MLAVGTLVLAPLLNLTVNSLESVQRETDVTYENYAAMAGINDGLWQLKAGSAQLPAVGENWTYSLPDTNGKTVEVVIGHLDEAVWSLTSTAAGSDGHSMEMSCQLRETGFPDNAFSSASISIERGCVINGNVQYDSANGTLSNKGTVNGEIIDQGLAWPSMEDVEAYYNDQIQGAPVYHGDLVINLTSDTLTNPYPLGPIYVDGALFITTSSGGAVRLDGLVYAKNRIALSPSVTVYMNNQTFFSDGLDGLGIALGSNNFFSGNGCLVARNQIPFVPLCDPDSYLVVWSLKSWAMLYSPGAVTGAFLAGEATTPGYIYTARQSNLTFAMPPAGLSLPPLPNASGGAILTISGWESVEQ